MYSTSTCAARRLLRLSLLAWPVLFLIAAQVQAMPVVAPTFAGTYTLTTFNGVPPSGATKPDDLAISADGKQLWVGYGNGANTRGQGGSSNAVEYDISSGAVLQNVSVPGHMDGLKLNPATGDVWTTENEDGNPTLAIINHNTGAFKIYTFKPTLITGGMDDLVLIGSEDSQNVFIVTSSQTDITLPVIVKISGQPIKTNTNLLATLAGNPSTVWNVVTHAAEAGDQIADPDSMTLDPARELVLDNRSDDSLYIVRRPGRDPPGA